MDDYCKIGLTVEEYAADNFRISELSKEKPKKQVKVLNKFKEQQFEILEKFVEDDKAIKIARQKYVNTTSLLHMICPSIEEGLSFEEAAEKSGKRFDKKISDIEKAMFYRLSVFVSKANSSDEKSNKSEKIEELEANVASKIKKIKDLEGKLKKATSDKTPEMLTDMTEKLKDLENLLKTKDDEIAALKDQLKGADLDNSKIARKRRAEKEKNFKTYAEARTEYRKLTDDEKCKYKLLTSKDAKRYQKEYDEYIEKLPEEDREAFISKRPRLEIAKTKAVDIFPGMPAKAPTNLRSLVQKEEMTKVLKKVKKEFDAASSQTEKFAIQIKAVNKYLEGLSAKEIKKRETRLQTLSENYDREMKAWYEDLEEENQAMYDRATWIDSRGKAPLWMDTIPKAPPSSIKAYIMEYVKQKLGDPTKEKLLEGYNQAKENKSRMQKLKNRHKDELANFPQKLDEWIESLNEFQKEVYYENEKLREGATITKEDLEFCEDILKKISESPEDEANILAESTNYERIKKFHLDEAGVKFAGNRRKLSEKRLMKAWKKAHSEGVNSEFMKDILKRVFDCKMKQLKKEEVTGPKASKGFQQQKAKKSAFQKKMDKAYGGEGHPPKPKSMYDCFKDEFLETGLVDDLKAAYKEFLKDNKKKAKATLEYEARKDDYKQQVLEWINTIGSEEKRKYQEQHMKDFTITEVASLSAEEDAADRLVYLDPKTPAAYDPSFLHAADDDEEDEE
ncbi:unnamed protein product [Oikopleura dioica]|uniref:Uncharacterized protein n=1 Tax=Oikopleura dioica TaxID=34765 RepID=E4XXQ3_OIKDI|nr:unnamed protein product [Oikopleura dioica]